MERAGIHSEEPAGSLESDCRGPRVTLRDSGLLPGGEKVPALSWTSICWNKEAAHSFHSRFMMSYSVPPIPRLQEKNIPENLALEKEQKLPR